MPAKVRRSDSGLRTFALASLHVREKMLNRKGLLVIVARKKSLILATVLAALMGFALIADAGCQAPAAPPAPAMWESAAHLHRTVLKKPISGTLVIDSEGVGFRSARFSCRWAFLEIHTFDLSNREITLTIYQNRHWHEPGEQRFHFTVQEDVPASVASIFAEKVQRPVRNGAPDASAPAIAEIPARHVKRFGGSNGSLRLRDTGIDYVSADGRDSHSWRWRDIQTIANPHPFSFRITAYREIVEFELKQPLSRELFNKLWDRLYARNLNVSTGGERR